MLLLLLRKLRRQIPDGPPLEPFIALVVGADDRRLMVSSNDRVTPSHDY